MCAFNYRFVPAVRLAQRDDRGRRARRDLPLPRPLPPGVDHGPDFPKVWRLDKAVAGSGALGDLGAHVIDLGRFLVGEPTAVNGVLRTFIKERPGGTRRRRRRLRGDRRVRERRDRHARGVPLRARPQELRCAGRSTARRARSSSTSERLNELQVNTPARRDDRGAQGFRDVLVSEAYHPYWQYWWPHGPHDRLGAHLRPRAAPLPRRDRHGRHAGRPVRRDVRGRLPRAEICDAIVRSHETRAREALAYRTL